MTKEDMISCSNRSRKHIGCFITEQQLRILYGAMGKTCCEEVNHEDGEKNRMTQEQTAKFRRMNDRLEELGNLNVRIARLAFFVNENEINEETKISMQAQLCAMRKYRVVLQMRIEKGQF